MTVAPVSAPPDAASADAPATAVAAPQPAPAAPDPPVNPLQAWQAATSAIDFTA